MLSKLRILAGAEPDDARPTLERGEEIVLEGRAERVTGLIFSRGWGFVIVTNRRLLWHERISIWRPWKWRVRQLNLSEIVSVDKGNLLHFLTGGRRLRVRVRDSKTQYLFQGGIEDTLGEWIKALRGLMSDPGVST